MKSSSREIELAAQLGGITNLTHGFIYFSPEASELAGRMIDGIGFEGKPLAAANLAGPEPEDPVARRWQRNTGLREWRGDVQGAGWTAAPGTAGG